MDKWEYVVIQLSYKSANEEQAYLDQAGEDGFELVSATAEESVTRLYMKRKKFNDNR